MKIILQLVLSTNTAKINRTTPPLNGRLGLICLSRVKE